jgi:aminoglycoside phosphotransferase (APT) family kinase protein
MPDLQSAAEAARQFDVPGLLDSIAPYGTGHINDTYCAAFSADGHLCRTILQRINTVIFRNPAALMENIERVTAHLARHRAADAEWQLEALSRRVLRSVPARDGRIWHTDADGNWWRMYHFIGGARTFDTVSSPGQAFQAAKAFGDFQRQLVDLPAPRLHDTIPDFHHTPKRFAAFARALAADGANRARHAKPEIELALAHQPLAGVLIEAGLPERVTHNDTKFNNVLFDDTTGEGICVLDLDTVMPGLALYDFGDMVRTATSPADEDTQDLARVTMQFPMFEALARGYLSAAGSFLTRHEKQLLVAGGKLITFEQGIRFLADYLNGDAYYKVHRPEQNLDRARTQFKLLASIEEQEEEMTALIESLADE